MRNEAYDRGAYIVFFILFIFSPYLQHLKRCHLLGITHLGEDVCEHTSAYVRIRQHTSAYIRIRQHTPAYVSHSRPHLDIVSYAACREY